MPSRTGLAANVGEARMGSADDSMLPFGDVAKINLAEKPAMAEGRHNRGLGQEIKGRE
jgi:hypothetical protein